MMDVDELHVWISFKGYVHSLVTRDQALPYLNSILKSARGTKKVPRGTFTPRQAYDDYTQKNER